MFCEKCKTYIFKNGTKCPYCNSITLKDEYNPNDIRDVLVVSIFTTLIFGIWLTMVIELTKISIREGFDIYDPLTQWLMQILIFTSGIILVTIYKYKLFNYK